MTDEGFRWFRITQDRKRELKAMQARIRKRRDRAKKREQAKRREQYIEARCQGVGVGMKLSEWTVDEHGNLSRILYGE